MELGRREFSTDIQKTQSDSDKRKTEFGFFKNTVEAVKKTARVIGFAVGATILVASCGGSKTFKVDAEDVADIADGHDTEDISDEPDILDTGADTLEVIDEDVSGDQTEDDIIEEDIESEDITEENEPEIVCVEGDSITGSVPSLIADTEVEALAFVGSAYELIHGDAETTIGADVSATGLLMLGECPYEDSIATFGVQGTLMDVIPSWRIDVTNASAVLPEFDEEVCAPPDELIPISMFNDNVNLSVIPALLGSYEGSATAGFSGMLLAAVLDGATEVTSPIMLSGANHEVKSIAVVSTSSSLGINSAVYSNTGTELYSTVLETSFSEKRSKTLKVIQLDSDDSMLPGIGRWQAEGISGPDSSTYVCLRPCLPDSAFNPVEKTVEITGLDITGVIDDSCGKLFASFDIISVTAEFDDTRFPYGIDPSYLKGDYSLLTGMHYGEGLDSLSGLSPKVYLYIRRSASTTSDTGVFIIMDVAVTAELETRDTNPAKGTVDSRTLSFIVRLSVPTSGDYLDVCGCDASLP